MRKGNREPRRDQEKTKKRFSFERGWKWCEIAIGIPWKESAGRWREWREDEKERKREREKMKPRDRANVAVAWPAKRRARARPCARETHRDVYSVGLFISRYIEAHFDERNSCASPMLLTTSRHFSINSTYGSISPWLYPPMPRSLCLSIRAQCPKITRHA